MTPEIKEQILEIRETGETNMFDVNTVQVMAHERGFHELVVYLEKNKKEYTEFILNGD